MSMRLMILLLGCCVSAFCQADAKRAQQLFDERNFTEARTVYLQLHRSEPSNALFAERLGDMSSHAANWEQAVLYYERLVSLQPKNPDAHYKYGGALSMQAAKSGKWKAMGMIGAIRSSFENAIILDPKHVAARWALVEYYLQVPGILGGSEYKANQYADELARLSPVDHYLAKGRIEEYFGRLENAEKQYRKAHAIGNSKTTRHKLDAITAKVKSQ